MSCTIHFGCVVFHFSSIKKGEVFPEYKTNYFTPHGQSRVGARGLGGYLRDYIAAVVKCIPGLPRARHAAIYEVRPCGPHWRKARCSSSDKVVFASVI